MTEAEWLACEDPQPILRKLDLEDNLAWPRKKRLLACACCRRVLPLLNDARSVAAVEVAERFADNLADHANLESTWLMVDEIAGQQWKVTATGGDRASAIAAILPSIACDNDGANIAYDAYTHLLELTSVARQPLQRAWVKQVIHCIFGPLLFRRVFSDPSWLPSTVTNLAQGIYAECAFDRMPILADALEDAGCTHADVLNHCRQPGEHVRGCWVVDLVLGKS
jgi:hypothetical protein